MKTIKLFRVMAVLSPMVFASIFSVNTLAKDNAVISSPSSMEVTRVQKPSREISGKDLPTPIAETRTVAAEEATAELEIDLPKASSNGFMLTIHQDGKITKSADLTPVKKEEKQTSDVQEEPSKDIAPIVEQIVQQERSTVSDKEEVILEDSREIAEDISFEKEIDETLNRSRTLVSQPKDLSSLTAKQKQDQMDKIGNSLQELDELRVKLDKIEVISERVRLVSQVNLLKEKLSNTNDQLVAAKIKKVNANVSREVAEDTSLEKEIDQTLKRSQALVSEQKDLSTLTAKQRQAQGVQIANSLAQLDELRVKLDNVEDITERVRVVSQINLLKEKLANTNDQLVAAKVEKVNANVSRELAEDVSLEKEIDQTLERSRALLSKPKALSTLSAKQKQNQMIQIENSLAELDELRVKLDKVEDITERVRVVSQINLLKEKLASMKAKLASASEEKSQKEVTKDEKAQEEVAKEEEEETQEEVVKVEAVQEESNEIYADLVNRDDFLNQVVCKQKNQLDELTKQFAAYKTQMDDINKNLALVTQLMALQLQSNMGPKINRGFDYEDAKRIYGPMADARNNTFGLQQLSLSDLLMKRSLGLEGLNYNVYNIGGDYVGGNMTTSMGQHPMNGMLANSTLNSRALLGNSYGVNMNRPFAFTFGNEAVMNNARFTMDAQSSPAQRSLIGQNIMRMNQSQSLWPNNPMVMQQAPAMQQQAPATRTPTSSDNIIQE